MPFNFIISGATKELQPGWSITQVINGVGNMRCVVVSLDGSYIPDLDNELNLSDGGTRLFGGHVNDIEEKGLSDKGVVPITSNMAAADFNFLATRVYGGLASPAGTLKQYLQALVSVLTNFGVSLDVAQVNGPSLAAADYTGWKFNDILDQLGLFSGGYVWEIDYTKTLRMYLPGAFAAPFNIAAGDGNAIGDVKVSWNRQNYANQVIVWGTGFTGSVQDSAGITAHGIWQLAIKAPDSKTQAEVDSLAAAILAASLPIVKRVSYDTFRDGIKPGQTQSINLPTRHINNTFLILEVETKHVGNVLRRTVKAIEGLQYQPGWREKIRTLGGGGGLTTPGLGGGGIAFVRVAYFLGGNGLDFVQTASSGQWVAASPIQVSINTVPRGTTAATVTGRLRALNAGISVQARLYDVTAAAACPGLSAIITSTAWSNISFAVTLTPGTHIYELQLQPSVGLEDVGAVAYVE